MNQNRVVPGTIVALCLNANIEVVRRANDYMACIKGHKEMWDNGKTINEAIGNLCRSHGDIIVKVIQHNTA